MFNKLRTLRWIALLVIFSLVAVACGSDSGNEDTTTTSESTTTTTAPPPDDTGEDQEPEDTTTTTQAPTPTTAPPPDDTGPAQFPLNVAIFAEPTTNNPFALWNNTTTWTNHVMPGNAALYTFYYPTYTFGPSLASDPIPPAVVPDGENWSVTVNLRDDVTWTDGTTITANDIGFTWSIMEKYGGLGGNFSSSWPVAKADDPGTDEDETRQGILSVEVLSDTQVKYTFNVDAGLAIWPFSVGGAPIFSQAYWQPIVDDAETAEDLYAAETLGFTNASSYISAQWEKGAFWRNEAIDNYWDKGSEVTVYSNGAFATERNGETETFGGDPSGDVRTEYVEGPHPSEVTYSIYGDQNSAVLALGDGEVDFMLNPLGLQRGLQGLIFENSELVATVNPSLGYRYMAFNLRKFPMSDKAFRQALACRIDKDFLSNTVLSGAAIPLNGFVPPGNAYYHNPDVSVVCDGLSEPERLAEAVRILKEAGWTWSTEPAWNEDNSDVLPKGEGIRGPNGETLSDITLLAPGPAYDPLRATYSLFIEEWANDLGFPIIAEPTGFNVIVDAIESSSEAWDIFILGWGIGIFPSYVFRLFAAEFDAYDGNGDNQPGFNNPEFETLWEQFQTTKTVEEARALIHQAEAILAEELPYVVLFTTPIIEAFNKKIQFPTTDVLGGIQNFFSGLESNIVLAE